MPAIRTNRADRMQAAFERAYRIGKARADMTEVDIAEALGYKSVTTLRKRRTDVSKLSLVDMAKLAHLLQMSEEEVSSIIKSMR